MEPSCQYDTVGFGWFIMQFEAPQVLLPNNNISVPGSKQDKVDKFISPDEELFERNM